MNLWCSVQGQRFRRMLLLSLRASDPGRSRIVVVGLVSNYAPRSGRLGNTLLGGNEDGFNPRPREAGDSGADSKGQGLTPQVVPIPPRQTVWQILPPY